MDKIVVGSRVKVKNRRDMRSRCVASRYGYVKELRKGLEEDTGSFVLMPRSAVVEFNDFSAEVPLDVLIPQPVED